MSRVRFQKPESPESPKFRSEYRVREVTGRRDRESSESVVRSSYPRSRDHSHQTREAETGEEARYDGYCPDIVLFRPRTTKATPAPTRLFSSQFVNDLGKLAFFTPFYHNRQKEAIGTLEIGDSGFSAVLSSEFDLLQLSAVSASDGCGIVTVRGSFPDTAILSRGQRFGFGFGHRVPAGPEYRIDGYLAESAAKQNVHSRVVTTRGWLNYRWPITREEFQCSDSDDAATVEIVSFWYVKDGDVVQFSKIIRRKRSKREPENDSAKVNVPFKLGDRIRFGCSCTSHCSQSITNQSVQYADNPDVTHDHELLTYTDGVSGSKLHIQCFQDDSHLKLVETDENGEDQSIFGDSKVRFISLGEEPVTMISMYSLRNDTSKNDCWLTSPPTLDEIEKNLGVASSSIEFWLLWKSGEEAYAEDAYSPNYERSESYFQSKLNIVGRTVEYLLSVAAVPVHGGNTQALSDEQPIGLLSDAVSSMRIDVVTLFWQIRFLNICYCHIGEVIHSSQLGQIACEYRLRIQRTLTGAIAWIYWCLDQQPATRHVHSRWYLACGLPASSPTKCKWREQQTEYLTKMARLTGIAPSLQKESSAQTNTDWGMYWMLSVFEGRLYIRETRRYVTGKTIYNQRLLERALKTPQPHESPSALHRILVFLCLYRWIAVEGQDGIQAKGQDGIQAKGRLESRMEDLLQSFEGIWDGATSGSTCTRFQRLPLGNDEQAQHAYQLAVTASEFPTLTGKSVDSGELDIPHSMKLEIDACVEQYVENFQDTAYACRHCLEYKTEPPWPIDWRKSSDLANVRIRTRQRPGGASAHWSPWGETCLDPVNIQSANVIGTMRRFETRNDYRREDTSIIFEDICRNFLQQNYSVVPSWDTTRPEGLSDRWKTETQAILSSNILDELMLEPAPSWAVKSGRLLGNSTMYARGQLDRVLTGNAIRSVLHNTMLDEKTSWKQVVTIAAMEAVNCHKLFQIDIEEVTKDEEEKQNKGPRILSREEDNEGLKKILHFPNHPDQRFQEVYLSVCHRNVRRLQESSFGNSSKVCHHSDPSEDVCPPRDSSEKEFDRVAQLLRPSRKIGFAAYNGFDDTGPTFLPMMYWDGQVLNPIEGTQTRISSYCPINKFKPEPPRRRHHRTENPVNGSPQGSDISDESEQRPHTRTRSASQRIIPISISYRLEGGRNDSAGDRKGVATAPGDTEQIPQTSRRPVDLNLIVEDEKSAPDHTGETVLSPIHEPPIDSRTAGLEASSRPTCENTTAEEFKISLPHVPSRGRQISDQLTAHNLSMHMSGPAKMHPRLQQLRQYSARTTDSNILMLSPEGSPQRRKTVSPRSDRRFARAEASPPVSMTESHPRNGSPGHSYTESNSYTEINLYTESNSTNDSFDRSLNLGRPNSTYFYHPTPPGQHASRYAQSSPVRTPWNAPPRLAPMSSKNIYPHYMVTSREDTPELFGMNFTERVAKCESKIATEFLRLKEAYPNKRIKFDPANFPDGYHTLRDEPGLALLDIDSQYNVSLFKSASDNWLDMARHIADSRVDTDAQFRFVIGNRYTGNLAKMHLILLHSDALSGINDYLGTEGKYRVPIPAHGCTNPHVIWETFLNIPFHALSDPGFETEYHRGGGIFPPPDILLPSDASRTLHEVSTCFIMTGSTDGQTWTCSTFGHKMHKELLDPGQMEEIRQIIRAFGHDPRSARCLIAQTFVGIMLSQVQAAYAEINTYMDMTLHPKNKGLLFEGVSYHSLKESEGRNKGSDRFMKLFLFEWAIRSLDGFIENIDVAVNHGENVIHALNLVMNEASANWCKELQQIDAEIVVVQYAHRRDQLERTAQDIRRLKERTQAYLQGANNLMSLEQARDAAVQSSKAVEQGNNIRVLTLITISYLPIGLVVSIYGMEILPNSAGFWSFGVVLAIAISVTVLSVINLQSMALASSKFYKRLHKFLHSKQNKDGLAGTEGDVRKINPDSRVPQFQIDSEGGTSISGESREPDGWKVMLMLIRYFLTTLPATEVAKCFSFLSRRAKPTPQPDETAQNTAANSKPSEPRHTSAPNPPGPPPAAPRGDQVFASRWQAHTANCKQCQQFSMRIQDTINLRSMESGGMCAVGKNMLGSAVNELPDDDSPMNRRVMARRNRVTGRSMSSMPETPSTPTPAGQSFTTEIDEMLQPEFQGTEWRKLSIRRPTFGKDENSIRLRSWSGIPKVLPAIWIIPRLLLLPVWLVVLALDYIAIFTVLILLGLLVDWSPLDVVGHLFGRRLRAKLERGGMIGSLIGWSLSWVMRPIGVIARHTEFVRFRKEEEDAKDIMSISKKRSKPLLSK